jgi:hypothetical protein
MVGDQQTGLEDDLGTEDAPSSRWSWRDWYAWVVVAGSAAFCLGPSLVGARTLLAVNSLTNHFPWVAAGPDWVGHEACTGDTIDSVMPGIGHIRGQLFGGHLSSWQDIVSGGSPLSSVPNLGLLDPLSLPYFIMPLSLAPAFVVLLTWVAAIGGTFLFLRRFSISRPAAVIAGFIYATSGFMVMWTNWPQTRVAALIPALFWALERLIARARASDLVLFAAVTASMLLGGFPAVTGWALYMAGAYLLVRVWFLYRGSIRKAVSVGAMAAGGLALGGILSAVQMLPFAYWFGHAPLAYRTGEPLAGLPTSGLVTLVVPNGYGLCVYGTASRGSVNTVELVAYVGAVAVVLAIAGAAFGFRRGRRAGSDGRGRPGSGGVRGCFVGAIVVMLLLGWLSPTARSVTAHLPVFADNFIGRIRSVLGFALAVLAAIGFDWLTVSRVEADGPVADGDDGPSRTGSFGLPKDPVAWARHIWTAAVLVGAGVVGILIVRKAYQSAAAAHDLRVVANVSWIPGLLLLAGFVLVGYRWAARRPSQTFAVLIVPILIAAPGVQFFHTVLPGDNPKSFYPNTATHKFLEANLGHDRYSSSGTTMYPATSLYYGLRTPTGHAFIEPAWQQLLQKIDPGVMQSPTNSDFGASINQTNIGDQPILDRMGVKYFVLPPGDLAGRVQPVPAASGSVSTATGPVTCSFPGQPLRGVTVRLDQALVPSNLSDGVTIDVALSSGAQRISSGRYLVHGAPTGTLLSVAIPGEDVKSGGAAAATLTETGATGPLVVSGSAGSASCGLVTPEHDGLKLVFADPGSVIYQRLNALPRIRWASNAVVIPTPSGRVDALAAGIPADEVVLNEAGPQTSGEDAQVMVTADSGDQISAKVTAPGAGYLVVADAMQQPGWSVTVDGKTAKLVPADDAMVAVAVPPGHHRINMSYTAPGEGVGAALTAGGVVVSLSLLWWDARRPRDRRHAKRRFRGPPDSGAGLGRGPNLASGSK